jgi:A/G-specific DNA glycosylase
MTPYRIGIPEIRSQQTQVNTAMDNSNRSRKQYPDSKSIKRAGEEDIYGLGRGVGHYRRASYIFKAKEIINKESHGEKAEEFDSPESLPGKGRTTAGAKISMEIKKQNQKKKKR